MAELVDALDSGSSGSNPLEVRVLFWAPKFIDFIRILVFWRNNGVITLSESVVFSACFLRPLSLARLLFLAFVLGFAFVLFVALCLR